MRDFSNNNLGHLYLPPAHCVTLDFLKEILAGRKKALRVDKVIQMVIPQLPEFTVQRALE